MSKIAARIYDRWFAPKRRSQRHYSAAKFNKHNSTWTTTPYSANYLLRSDHRSLTARAREMCRNFSHFKKFLQMVRSNVIGPQGMRLQCRARKADGSLNVKLNKQIEEAFWAWGHRESCSVSGKLDWIAAQNLFVTHLARDGEALVQFVPADNDYGFALKFIDVTYLDDLYNAELPNGGRIIMSVEIDSNGKPVAYWLTTPPSDIMFAQRRERQRTRIPADQMIHAFLVSDDESQVRGITWFHSAMVDAKDLAGYKEGVIKSARFASNAIGFLEKEVADGQDNEYEGETDENGRQITTDIEVEQLSMNELPVGYKLNQFDPKQPTQNHEAFYKSIVRDLAAGVGVNYFSLQGDMAAVNFSSGRLGLNEERDLWRAIQHFVASMFCREVYHAWLTAALMSGAVKLNAKQYSEVRDPIFRGRGWPYIEPLKDITASSLALANKLTSWTDELAERGIDLADHLETLQSEQVLAQSYGIDLVPVSKITETGQDPNAPEPDSGKKPPPKRELTNGHSYELLEN